MGAGTMTERRFQVIRDQSKLPKATRMAWPESLPWSMVEPWGRRAKLNHDQTLERLNERGGLSPSELWLIAHDLPLRDIRSIDEQEAGAWLQQIAAS